MFSFEQEQILQRQYVIQWEAKYHQQDVTIFSHLSTSQVGNLQEMSEWSEANAKLNYLK